jgi:hypothetical protein
MWTWTLWEQLMQDLRYTVRTMIYNPAFTMLAALSLALGIGANTAIYSFMDSILLRSLPVSDPASLVVLNWHSRDPRETRDANGNWAPHVMHGMSGHTYNDPTTGLTSGIFPFPFPAFQEQRFGLSSLLPITLREANPTIGTGRNRQSECIRHYFRGLAVAPSASV